MKNKIIALVFLVHLSFCALSQTEKETVDWLIQKLDKFKTDRSLTDEHWEESKIAGEVKVKTYYSYTNYSYSIVGDLLIIKCDFLEERQGKKDISLKLRDEIKISEISSISYSNKMITFNTYDYSIKTFSNGKANKDLNNYSLGGLNSQGENNLGNRINEAFNHLKTFYPRKKAKEIF